MLHAFFGVCYRKVCYDTATFLASEATAETFYKKSCVKKTKAVFQNSKKKKETPAQVFPMNFANSYRTPFLKNFSGRLFL